MAVGLICLLTAPFAAAAPAAGDHWVVTCGASPQETADTAAEQTYRLMVHTSVGGTTDRVHPTNLFGTQPVTFGAAYLAPPTLSPDTGTSSRASTLAV